MIFMPVGWADRNPLANLKKTVLEILKNYYDELVENDIRSVDNVSRDVDKVKLFLHSYARNISTECSIEKRLSNVNDNNPKGISDETVKSYIKAFHRFTDCMSDTRCL